MYRSSKHLLANLAPALVTLPLALLLACSDLGSLGAGDDFSGCDPSEGNAPVEGSWVIQGSGQLYGCGSESRDGDISIRSQVLAVTQTPKGGDSSVDSIQLVKPLSVSFGEFNLSGEVSGSCVNFETRESRQGGAIIYRFIGKASSLGDTVTGTFTVDTPDGCSGDGNFSIEIQ